MCRISVATFSMPERDHAQRGEEHRVAVAGDHLRADGLGLQPHHLADMLLDRGSMLAKVPTAPEIAPVAISSRARRRRSRLRSISAWKRAKVRPSVVGSAWMPWLRPMRGVSLCS
jgi:hypothetical protein